MNKKYEQQQRLPNNRIKVDFEAYHKPSWKQRLKILIGYNIVARSYVFIDRKNEEVRAGTSFSTTEHLTAEQQAANSKVGE